MHSLLRVLVVTGVIGVARSAPAEDPDELHLAIEAAGSDATRRMVILQANRKLEALPDAWGDRVKVNLTGPDGRPRAACATVGVEQVPGRSGQPFLTVSWLEPVIEAGSKPVFTAKIMPSPDAGPASPFAFQDSTDGTTLTENGRPVFESVNRFDPDNLENTKKVFHHVWDPSGTTLLTKGPGGKFPHHRGIFLGWKKTSIGDRTWDSWHMPDGDNTQRSSVPNHLIIQDQAVEMSGIDWHDPAGEIYLSETRLLKVWRAVEGGRLLDVFSMLMPADGVREPIRLDGDMQHAGLQFRASNEVATDTEQLTEFIFPSLDGKPGKFIHLKHPDDSIMGKDPKWGCMQFTVEGKRFGVLYICHPANKRPAEFSIRYYGRFGEFFPYTLAPGGGLEMHYRFFIFEGEREPEYLEAVYQGFANPREVKIVDAKWVGEKAVPSGKPRTFLIDPDDLTAVRDRIAAGNAELMPALEALKSAADEALSQQPVSVMDKEMVPPSGDKHDYMSMGSYWWPNPKTPDGLPYIRKDGHANPEGQKLDRPRLQKMCTAVDTLALASYLTGYEPYAEHAAVLLRTWFLDPETKMNPHLEYGQGIPGICEGRGIGIIDTAGRFARLVDSIGMLENSEAWTDEDQTALHDWFDRYLMWLLESEKGIAEARQPNNHGTFYDVQAAALALFLDQPETAREILEAVPAKRIATQIEPDGKQPWELRRTKSFGYSTANLTGFFELAALGDRAGVDLWNFETDDGRGIRKALDFLVQYAGKPEAWPNEEIQGLNWGRYPMLLRRAANAYDEPAYEAMIEKLPGVDSEADRFHLLYPRHQ